MQVKVHEGTTRHDQASLCLSCRHATVVKGHRLEEQLVFCDLLYGGNNRIRFPVASCSGFASRTHPTIREMEEIAWVLRTDPNRKPIGFVAARDLKPEDRYVLPEDEQPW